jgi:hypothetical protein
LGKGKDKGSTLGEGGDSGSGAGTGPKAGAWSGQKTTNKTTTTNKTKTKPRDLLFSPMVNLFRSRSLRQDKKPGFKITSNNTR